MVQPDELRRMADTLREAGRETAADASLLRSYGSMFREWMSPAAEQFNSHQYEGSFSQFDLVERDAEDMARILDDLAGQLAEQLAVIRRTAENVRAFFHAPPAWACGTAEDPNPVWVRIPWRYQPYNLPPDDAPEWLTVGNHFRTVYGVNV